ncbi:unnamed protein product [Prorocentrum cordatum]|uniref:PilZ domain-containing protein n=1 Tax=Prorocentrum cordatum TaxID=2364126 RepID=A0ABN9X4M9_9DINO|nr:unnamed protein product [Polarella glacialis]
MAQLRPRWLPEPLPPLLTARLRARRAGEPCVFSLGGVLCAGADAAELRVSCAPAGLCLEPGGAERLDLRLTTELRGVPAAGRLWGLVGCGGRWWFQKVRLPVVRGALQEFHEMVHEQMTLFYVAALAG